MPKFIFLDTNIYLHYQDFDQTNWLEIAPADSVTIIIPPVTIRELNKHKDSHPQIRIRKRARAILRKLSALFESDLQGQLRNGIVVQLEDRDPLIDFEAHNLCREIQDDHLIASIIMCRDELSSLEVVLVTSDAGLTLVAKAKRHGITTIKLPDRLKLPEEPDPDQERVRKLEQELRKLNQKIPQPLLTFEDGNQHVAFTLPRPLELADDEIAKKVEELKARYPKMKEASDQDNRPQKANIFFTELTAGLNESVWNGMLPEDITNYNSSLDRFYQAYGRYLQNQMHFENLKRRTIKLEVWLANDGTAPTEDIDIFMHFPDGFTLISEDDFPESPETLEPPPKPKTMREKFLEPFSESISIPYMGAYTSGPILPPRNVSSPNIRRSGSYDVDIQVQRIKHKLREPLDTLFVVFESYECAHSFQIDYRILAANLPDESSGKLHVVIQMENN